MTDPSPVLRAETALELLRQTVRGREDYVYNSSERGGYCLYTELDPESHERRPSCLVGQALLLHGVPLERIALLDDGMASTGADDLPDHEDDLGVYITEAAAKVFAAAQSHQDRAEPWKDALAAALDAYENLEELGYSDGDE